MAIKKSALYKNLWESCNQLRGGMDASQYKNYILTLLFVKYVSDKYAGKPNAVIVVPERGSFTHIQNLQGNDDIGNGINKALAALEKKNENLKGVFEVDFNDADKFGGKKDMVDCLSGLVGKLAGLQLGKNRAGGDDLLGDAYEYLMRNFATESGKSKGEFYTPAEVSRIMAKIIGVKNAKPKNTVYDPTCGSGSLLLKVADESPIKLSLYGQEKDVTTAGLAKMNMILHNNETAEIGGAGRSTLSNPEFPSKSEGLKRFDFVVANPPFSLSSWRNGMDPHNDEYGRFAFGVPPAKNGDYAFLLHILKSINSDGAGAVIMPHGVLFRGNVEGEIRKNILQQGFVEGVIGLPPNLFYGTGIPACIVVINKRNAQARKSVFMVRATDGFIKDGPKNRLRAQDIHKIVAVFTKQKEIAGYSRLVPMAEIEANGHNLNLPRYIASNKGEDRQSLAAHLHGGIPQEDINALAAYWKAFPKLRRELLRKGKNGRLNVAVETGELRGIVLQAAEFLKFANELDDALAAWQEKQTPHLEGLDAKIVPKDVIFTISEALLAAFADKPLLDHYAVYQLLMDYWSETMEDDVYRICDMGWRAAAQPEPSADKANLQIGNGKNARHYSCDLIPPELLTKIYFTQEQDAIAALVARHEGLLQQQAEMAQEHGGDEGLLRDATKDGKLVWQKIKELLRDTDEIGEGELWQLKQADDLLKRANTLNKQINRSQQELNSALLEKYGELSVGNIKDIVLEQKWFAVLRGQLKEKTQSVALQLVARLTQLQARYATPLSQLEAEAKRCVDSVGQHIKSIGLKTDAMQKLLTGKTRLPRFTGKWKLSSLGKLVHFIRGKGLSKSKLASQGNPCILYGELFTSYKEVIRQVTSKTVCKEGTPSLSGDILMPGSTTTVGIDLAIASALMLDGVLLGGDVNILRAKKDNYDPIFLAYYLTHAKKREIEKATQGITIIHLNCNNLADMPLLLPPTKAEQVAIASLLPIMDANIGAHERLLRNLLEKAKYVKIATMQELLTGKTRLPASPKTPRQKRQP